MVVTIILVAVTVGLAFAVWKLSSVASANRDDPALWVYLLRMRYLALVLLLLAVALLAMKGIRWITRTMKPRQPSEPTSDISAWKEAGKRFQLPPEDQDEEGDAPDE